MIEINVSNLETHFSDLETLSEVHLKEESAKCERDENVDADNVTMDETDESISRLQSIQQMKNLSQSEPNGSPQMKIISHFISIPHGLILKATYEHGKKHMEIMGVTYNERMRQFVILDSKGITTWKRDAVEARVFIPSLESARGLIGPDLTACQMQWPQDVQPTDPYKSTESMHLSVHRALTYPKYEYRLITNMVYAKKFNCYFTLGKDFSLKVLNKEFIETCSVSADLRSVIFMLFNPLRDELITGGVGGTKVWHFHQQPLNTFGDLKDHANFVLTLRYELPNIGGSWVKRVELDYYLGHLYFCSDHDLFTYDLEGKLLFKFERAHSMSITGCRYSSNASVLATSSLDSEVKVWSLIGGLVHTFRGHSRAVTNLIMHPMTSSIIITCSLDGSVRMWSLDTMDCLYSLVVSVDGIQWMGLTDDVLYLCTPRTLTLWSLNYIEQFWALARSQVTKIMRCGCSGKTTRILAVSEDSSVRLIARSNSKCLTTILPPPSISPLQKVISVCCSREFNTVYLLVNSYEIWVYTTRTDPACRIAVWPVIDIQRCYTAMYATTAVTKVHRSLNSVDNTKVLYTVTENLARRNEGLLRCNCLEVLTSAVVVWTSKGHCCPVRDTFLLVGLEDGRIFFMDPIIKGRKFVEFKTGNDPVLNMYNDVVNSGLITLHKQKDMIKVMVWCVPDLILQHEVYAEPDLRDFARESNILVTGHESGCIIFHKLEPVIHGYKEKVKINHKPEHQAPVITVDVCVALKLFCSCSEDGTIKIWYDRVLLTEIVLDTSLSSACFLNSRGYLLVGYQKHLFIIDHSKVCPQLTITESDVETFDQESHIFEDPSVTFEGVAPSQDHVTLENYLVPFDGDIAKGFLEGRESREPEGKNEEISDGENESVISVAPTEIYLSPDSTPRRRLSFVDLVLSSEVSIHDLSRHMKKFIDHVAQKEKTDAIQILHEQQMETGNKALQSQTRNKKHLTSSKNNKINLKGNRRKFNKGEVEERKDIRFCFPRVGNSPAPSPEVSSESEDEPQELNVTDENDVKMQLIEVYKVDDDDDDEASTLVISSDKERPEIKAPIEPFTSKTKFGFNNIKVDTKSHMTDTKKTTVVVPKRRPEQTHVQADSEKSFANRQTPVKKKMTVSQRRISKSNQMDKIESRDEPATQIQTFELHQQEPCILSLSLTEDVDMHNVMEKKEASFTPDKEDKNKSSSVSNLEEASVESENTSISIISIPDLPCVPVVTGSQHVSRPLVSKLKEAKSQLSHLQPVTHFVGQSKTDKNGNESDDAGIITVQNSNKNDNSKTVNAVSNNQMGYVSLASEESNNPVYSIRTGFMSEMKPKDKVDIQERISSSVESSFDSTLVTRDIISISTQHLKAHDQMLDESCDVTKHRISGTETDLTSQEQIEVLPSPEFIKVEVLPSNVYTDNILNKQDLENVVKYFKQRSHTAETRFSTEEMLDASMDKNKPMLRSSLASGRKEDQRCFENWHERQIERHMLIRLQKELREHNVLKKRQMIQSAQQENWKKLIMEDYCTVADSKSASDLSNTKQRASTVHGNRPAINIPRATPMSTRPQTASGMCSPLQSHNQPKLQPFQTMQQHNEQTKSNIERLQKIKLDHQEQSELKNERPFRCRLRQQQPPQNIGAHLNSEKLVDPWQLDPRNPLAVRPKSSSSIPSKCHHFVLVNKPKVIEDFPLPTTLEKYLLALRFPQYGLRVFRRTEKILLSKSLYHPDSRTGYTNFYQDQIFR